MIDRKKLREFLTGMAVGYLHAGGYVVTYDPTQSNPLEEMLQSLRERVGGPAFGGPCGKSTRLLGYPCGLPVGHGGPCAVRARGCRGPAGEA